MHTIDEINKKYINNILKPGLKEYIHISLLKEYLNDIINNGYKVLGYDGIIINNKGTLSPLELIFDFSRGDYSDEEKNVLAIINVDEILKRIYINGYKLDDLYVDVVIKK